MPVLQEGVDPHSAVDAAHAWIELTALGWTAYQPVPGAVVAALFKVCSAKRPARDEAAGHRLATRRTSSRSSAARAVAATCRCAGQSDGRTVTGAVSLR